jgi:hypothetical protein
MTDIDDVVRILMDGDVRICAQGNGEFMLHLSDSRGSFRSNASDLVIALHLIATNRQLCYGAAQADYSKPSKFMC